MMKTKHLFQILIVFLLTYQMNGQIKWGVQLGLNNTSISQSISDDYKDYKYPTKSKFGFNLGIVAEYPLNDQMGLQTALLFTQKGFQIDWDALLKREGISGSVDGYWIYNYNYLALPLHFYYNIDNIYLTAGPYFAYGLGGTSKIDATYTHDGSSDNAKQTDALQAVSGSVDEDIFFDDESDISVIKAYNAFDVGLDLGVGYKLQQFMLKLQYSIGFNNLTPHLKNAADFDPNNLKKTNKGFNISLVYYFTK